MKCENLIVTREKFGWSQKELGDKIGISQQYVSLIETGKRRPSEELANKISIIYGKSVKELF